MTRKKGNSIVSDGLKGLDLFGMAVPSLNIEGDSQVRTMCGGIVTCLILVTTLFFAAETGTELLSPMNPQINDVITQDYFGSGEEDAIRLKDTDFKLAFTVREILTNRMLNDSRYVKWVAYFTNLVGGKRYYDRIGFHECTEQDYAEFYPVTSSSQPVYQTLKEQGLFCLDDLPEDAKLGGDFMSEWRSMLSISIVPCNVILFEGDEVGPECIADRNDQRAYLGTSIQFAYLSNFDRLDQDHYGENVVIKESVVTFARSETNLRPIMNTELTSTLVNDEKSFFGSYHHTLHGLYPSAEDDASIWNEFPTEQNPYGLYSWANLRIK